MRTTGHVLLILESDGTKQGLTVYPARTQGKHTRNSEFVPPLPLSVLTLQRSGDLLPLRTSSFITLIVASANHKLSRYVRKLLDSIWLITRAGESEGQG